MRTGIGRPAEVQPLPSYYRRGDRPRLRKGNRPQTADRSAGRFGHDFLRTEFPGLPPHEDRTGDERRLRRSVDRRELPLPAGMRPPLRGASGKGVAAYFRRDSVRKLRQFIQGVGCLGSARDQFRGLPRSADFLPVRVPQLAGVDFPLASGLLYRQAGGTAQTYRHNVHP